MNEFQIHLIAFSGRMRVEVVFLFWKTRVEVVFLFWQARVEVVFLFWKNEGFAVAELKKNKDLFCSRKLPSLGNLTKSLFQFLKTRAVLPKFLICFCRRLFQLPFSSHSKIA